VVGLVRGVEELSVNVTLGGSATKPN
jgi:hypothetical protein